MDASSQADTGLWASLGIHLASKATCRSDPSGMSRGVVNASVKSSGTAFSSEESVTDWTDITSGGLMCWVVLLFTEVYLLDLGRSHTQVGMQDRHHRQLPQRSSVTLQSRTRLLRTRQAKWWPKIYLWLIYPSSWHREGEVSDNECQSTESLLDRFITEIATDVGTKWSKIN